MEINTTTNPAQQESIKRKRGRPVKSAHKDYLSLKQASVQLNIPIQHLKIIKQLYPEGFKVNTVHADLVAKYYIEHKQEILEQQEHSIDTLKKEKLANDIILQNLEIAKRQNRMIDIEELEEFLKKLGLSVSNLLLSKLVNELPDRINRTESAKRISLCKDMYNEVVDKFKSDVETWLETHKENIKDEPNKAD